MFKQLCIVMLVCVDVLGVSAVKGNVAKATTILCIGDLITEGGSSVLGLPLSPQQKANGCWL